MMQKRWLPRGASPAGSGVSLYNRAVARPRIVFIRLGAIGDVARTLPALSLVRKHLPDAFLAWVVEDRAYPLLRRHPDLDQVILLDRRALTRQLSAPDTFFHGFASAGGVLSELRKGRFTIALDFQGTFKSGIIALATGAEQRIGYDAASVKEGNHLFTNVHVALPPPPLHRVLRNVALLAPLGIHERPERVAARLPLTDAEREEADRVLAAIEVPPGAPFVFLYPGSSGRQAYKRIPAAILAGIAGRLAGSKNGPGGSTPILVLGTGPGEEAVAQAIRAQAGDCVRELPPTTLMGMAEVIRRAALFIGGDTGPMHLAWLQGVPVIAVFGPTDPALNAPYGAVAGAASEAAPALPRSSTDAPADPVPRSASSPATFPPGVAPNPVQLVFDALAGAAATRRPRDPRVFDALDPARIGDAAVEMLSRTVSVEADSALPFNRTLRIHSSRMS